MRILLIAVFCTVAFGQAQPYGLKGDTLGETLQAFLTRNAHTLTSDPRAPNTRTKHMPQCTGDKMDDSGETLSADVYLSGETEERAGVVKCIAALSMNDDLDFHDDPTIAGIRAYRTVYYFFRDRLYMIRSELPGDSYHELRQAFIVKYGTPSITMVHYQNSFGANATGQRLHWRNNLSQIAIGEMDAPNNNILLVILHNALLKECESAGAAKNRAKDL